MVEGISTDDSLLLSSAEAVNDNLSREIKDFEDSVYRFQAMADAHPEVNYDNTASSFSVPYEDIMEKSVELQEMYQSLVQEVTKSRNLTYANSKPRNESDLKWRMSERRSSLHTNLEEVYDLYAEIRDKVNESEPEVKSEPPASV